METGNIRLTVLPKTFDGFFEENLSKFKTHAEAYEAAEKEVEKLTGSRKYANHNSYKVSRHKRYSRKR